MKGDKEPRFAGSTPQRSSAKKWEIKSTVKLGDEVQLRGNEGMEDQKKWRFRGRGKEFLTIRLKVLINY